MVCGLISSCSDYFSPQFVVSFAETDHKIDFFQTVTLSLGYNRINLSSQFNYFRGGMFLIDQNLGGRIALNITINDSTCVSDYFPVYNHSRIQSMKTYSTPPPKCKRFYFKAHGQKYVTTGKLNFTRSFSTTGNLTILASFNNYVNQSVNASQLVNVYGKYEKMRDGLFFFYESYFIKIFNVAVEWTEWSFYSNCIALRTYSSAPGVNVSQTVVGLDCSTCRNSTLIVLFKRFIFIILFKVLIIKKSESIRN